MRRIFAALLALCALAGCVPAAAPAPRHEPALWRIHDADSEIWLFGSAHILPQGLNWRGSAVERAFASADEIVTETDAGPEATQAFQHLATALGGLPAGESLIAKLDADDLARLQRVAGQARLDWRSLEHERPWLAALQLSYFSAVNSGHSPDNGVENILLGEAQTERKRHSFLETPEEQVHVLADLAPADELRFLRATLRQIEEEAEHPEAMDQAWARGDLSGLSQQLDAQIREAGPAVHDALIVDRNRRWADRIEQRLHGSGKIFVAVGAAHLVGPASVIDLLRQRGIEVDGP